MTKYDLTLDSKLIVMEDEFGKSWCDSNYNDVFWKVTASMTLSITATNAYARKTQGTIVADPEDDGEFTISRGEGNTTDALKVYYKIDTVNVPSNEVAAVDGTDYEKIDTQVDPTYGPYVIIPANLSSTTIDIVPIENDALTWDQVVKLDLTGTDDPTHYEVSPDETDSVTIFNDADVSGMVDGNADSTSTGQSQQTVGNNQINVNVQGGQVTLTGALPSSTSSPIYEGNDNLQPIISVETRFPTLPGSIQAVLNFGDSEHATVGLTVPSQVTATDTMRFVILGPADLEQDLASGHYDWDIQFNADQD